MARLDIGKHLLATASVAAVVVGLVALMPGVNLTTVGLVLVLAITLVSVRWGSGPGLAASVAALLAFNYFFIPPVHTWVIRDPENLVAFFVFFLTALAVGQLSSRAKRQAVESEARRQEIERLYSQLRKAFEEASEAESLRRSERLKTALLDAVTHDLRTPLTSIKASVTTLLGDDASLPPEVSRELLLVINEESDRLDRFVEEMMTVARIEGGQLLLRRSPQSALDLINSAMDRASQLLAGHPVEVTVDPSLPRLLVDGASSAEVIFELLENAAHYSGPGTPIHLFARQVDGQTVEIAVEDRGIGIPAEFRERVFQKFFRAPGGSRERRGFGMGLSIARGIVEAHGGRIWIDGAAGRGTIVRFTLPCQAAVHHEPDALQDIGRR